MFTPFLNGFDLGFSISPNWLTDFMNQQGEQCLFELHSNLSLDDILNRLCQGVPVIPLIVLAWESAETINNFFPPLHYIVLVGYDVKDKVLFYKETNGRTYQISYDDFLKRWQFNLDGGYKITRWVLQSLGAVGGLIISPVFYDFGAKE